MVGNSKPTRLPSLPTSSHGEVVLWQARASLVLDVWSFAVTHRCGRASISPASVVQLISCTASVWISSASTEVHHKILYLSSTTIMVRYTFAWNLYNLISYGLVMLTRMVNS